MAHEFAPGAVRLAIAPFVVADIPDAVQTLMVTSGADEVGIRPQHGLLEVRFAMRPRRTRSEVLKRRRPENHRGYDPGRSTTVGVGFPSEGALFAPFDLLEHPERFYELFPAEHWDDVFMAVEAVWDGMLRRLEDEVSAERYRILARIDRTTAPVEEIALSSWRHFLIDNWEYGIASTTRTAERLIDVHLVPIQFPVTVLASSLDSELGAADEMAARGNEGASLLRPDEKSDAEMLDEQIREALHKRVAYWPTDKAQPGGTADWKYVESEIGHKVDRQRVRELRVGIVPGADEKGRRRNPQK